jgi:thioredoxin 1
MRKFLLLSIVILLLTGCGKTESAQNAASEISTQTAAAKAHTGKQLVTFIEIGSVNCIPCNLMQPVMKKVEETFGRQVKVIFYDVWTPAGKPYGEKYNVRAIPTQVYLDADGKEFKRHVGYAPFEDVKEILAKKGVR